MTRREARAAKIDELGPLDTAHVGCVAAARMKPATARGVDRARHLALEDDPLASCDSVLLACLYHRDRGQQRLGVGVDRARVEVVGRRDLDDDAQVHHRDPVGDVADDAEVVGDEDVGEVELVLEVVEQVDDLRLDRHVERRNRLVGDDQLWAQRERTGDADPLALSARELMRIAVDVIGGEADHLGARSLHLLVGSPRVSRCGGCGTGRR